MITEYYVSFNIAKLLKEKEFESDDCHTAYDKNGKFFLHGDYLKNRYGIVDAPTLQMAMKWLREVHKLGVFPSTYTTIKGNNIIHTYGTAIINLNTYKLMTLDSMDRETYEEACEAAIKYCLEKLI